MNMFIVESPGKVKHIPCYRDALFGQGAFAVVATVGHFCGLPSAPSAPSSTPSLRAASAPTSSRASATSTSTTVTSSFKSIPHFMRWTVVTRGHFRGGDAARPSKMTARRQQRSKNTRHPHHFIRTRTPMQLHFSILLIVALTLLAACQSTTSNDRSTRGSARSARGSARSARGSAPSARGSARSASDRDPDHDGQRRRSDSGARPNCARSSIEKPTVASGENRSSSATSCF